MQKTFRERRLPKEVYLVKNDYEMGCLMKVTREDRGLLQKQLAPMLNVAAPTLSQYETGERPVPDKVWAEAALILHSERMLQEQLKCNPVYQALRLMRKRMRGGTWGWAPDEKIPA